MKKISVLFLSVSLYFSVQAQQSETALKIANHEISLADFEAIYNKNNNLKTPDKKTFDEYVELFVNFKLKVKEGEDLGLDTSQKFINELAGYKDQLAKPYLIDKDVNEDLIKEAYERMKLDIKASHILVRVNPNDSPNDTLRAYNKIMDYYKRAKKGTDFNTLMQEIITENNRNPNEEHPVLAEDLGYFTCFQMVYPFETEAYKTKVGDVSEVVKTRFGYHIIKVNDKRPARGEVKVAHIMVKVDKNAPAEEIRNAQNKIDEIYKLLEQGEQFEAVAQKHSEDQGSAKNGGELQWFGTGRMVLEFEDASYNTLVGNYSKPVQTQFGFHIVKKIDEKKIGSFDDLKTEIKTRVSRDSRSQISRESLIENLKLDYGYVPNQKRLEGIYKLINPSYFEGKWDFNDYDKYKATLFRLDDAQYSKRIEDYKEEDFLKHLHRIQKKQVAQNPKKYVDAIFNAYVEEKLIAFEESVLEYKYPEFKALMQEYRDGIILFDMMEKRVWRKANEDTLGLNNFYKQNVNNYLWDKRVDASIYTCKNAEIAKKTQKLLKKQLKKGVNNDELLKVINAESQLNLNIESDRYLKGDNEMVDNVVWKEGLSEVKELNGKTYFVLIKNVLPEQPKMLDECRGLVTSDYQNYLEKEWIKELRAKYPVEVYQDVLHKAKSK